MLIYFICQGRTLGYIMLLNLPLFNSQQHGNTLLFHIIHIV